MFKFAFTSRQTLVDEESSQRKKGLSATIPQTIQRKYEELRGSSSKYKNLPRTCIKHGKLRTLIQVLALPIKTPRLTTLVADLHEPLVRSQSSDWPKELCTIHAWYNVQYLNHFAELVAKELHYRSEWLWKFPKQSLNRETRELLYITLESFKDLFQPKFLDDSKVERVKTPCDAFVRKERYLGQTCVACKLTELLQDVDATAGLALLCKSRKRHKYEWPELLAFLEPIIPGSDDGWRNRWLKESSGVRRDREKIRNWKRCGGGADLAAEGSEIAEEVPIIWTPDREDFVVPVNPSHASTALPAQNQSAIEDEYEDESYEEFMGHFSAEQMPHHGDFSNHIPYDGDMRAPRGRTPTLGEIQDARQTAYNALNGARP